MLNLLNALRETPIESLKHVTSLEAILLSLGIGPGDSKIFIQGSYPPYLAPWFGTGLRIYQNHKQFAKYLIFLSDKRIQSYLEIGVLFGGAFVVTCEYLKRFTRLERAVAVDVRNWNGPLSLYNEYQKFEFWQMGTDSPEFIKRIEGQQFDLCMVDGDHSYASVSRDVTIMRPRSRFLAIHDIVDQHTPGVRQMWRELIEQGTPSWSFTEQYEAHPGCHMGIGLIPQTASPVQER